MAQKDASSQAAWALIIEGVTAARIEVHRLRHLTNRVMQLVDDSDHTDHLYQIAGDIIHAVPRRLERMEIDLDRTSLALAKMGEGFLESRLPLGDKVMVDEAIQSAFGGGRMRYAVERVAARWVASQEGS